MKYNILIGVLLLASVTFAVNSNVASEFSNPSYETNRSVDFLVLCDYNTSLCVSPLVLCNVTIFYPNNTMIFQNASMNYVTNGVYNYTIDINVTNVLGTYSGVSRCYTPGNKDFVGFGDVSFRIVDKLLYHGGGVSTFDIAITLGLVLAALGMTLAGMFAKALWMRVLMTFSGMTTLIIQGDVMLKIVANEGLATIEEVLIGFYFLSVFVAITALALLLVNILWDYTNLFVGIEQWSQQFKKKKPETLEE